MSVDLLQEKIRKTKNPGVLVLEADLALLPAEYTGMEGLRAYYGALLEGL